MLRLEGVGLSVVAPTQELLYARLSGIQARATQSKARRTLESAVRHIQADNTLASATYPVWPSHTMSRGCLTLPSGSADSKKYIGTVPPHDCRALADP